MADVLLTAMPFSGHVGPVLRAAEALAAAGHVVRLHTGSAFAERCSAAGIEMVPWAAAPDFDEHDLPATFPQAGRGGPLGLLGNLEHVFIRSAVGQVADLTAEFARRPWDLVVADSLSLGGALAAERTGTRWATISVVPLSMTSRDLPPPGLPVAPARGPLGRLRDHLLRLLVALGSTGLRRALRQTRAAVGLDPRATGLARAWFSPWLVLALGAAGLEPPRRDLPGHVHFIGAFPTAGGIAPPEWWEGMTALGRPVVHVTQGTFDLDAERLLHPALTGLAASGTTVVAATGLRGRRPAFAVPENAFVADLLPYDLLLPRTAAVVTNGGWGGVLASLTHGIPLVVAGADLDKPVIAAMVARSGAGIDLRTGDPSPEQVARAVARVLHEPSFGRAAAALGEELRSHDAAAELVALIDRLLQAGGPVLRAAPAWPQHKTS